MTTILFVSEGPTDIGPSFERGKLENEQSQGVICGLVKKIIAQETGRYPDELESRTLPAIRLHRHQEKHSKESSRGLAQKVKYVMQQLADADSVYHDCDAVVFVVDQDDQPERIKELLDGRDKARKLPDMHNIRIALGMAIVKLEAWLLADAKALRQGLRGNNIQQPPHPEEIKDPKKHIRELFREDDHRSTLEKFMAVVENIDDVRLLVTQCPQGFAPFYEEVKSEIARLF